MSNETILDRWHVTAEELTEVIDFNPSLRGMVLGYLAEVKLKSVWFSGPEIQHSIKYDDHDRKKKGDIVVTYRGHKFIIECKSLQTNSIKINRENGTYFGKAQCDASDRRTVSFLDGSVLETTCLQVGEFDILAVCVFGFRGEWEFHFVRNQDLPRSSFRKYSEIQRSRLLASLVPISIPIKSPFYDNPFTLMDEIIQERTR